MGSTGFYLLIKGVAQLSLRTGLGYEMAAGIGLIGAGGLLVNRALRNDDNARAVQRRPAPTMFAAAVLNTVTSAVAWVGVAAFSHALLSSVRGMVSTDAFVKSDMNNAAVSTVYKAVLLCMPKLILAYHQRMNDIHDDYTRMLAEVNGMLGRAPDDRRP
jgi:hypothetical protein